MQCSDARTLANRENARKSTGPRTEAGKARSRANAFQHGLAGDGVAWPGELEGQMRRFVDEQVAAEPIAPGDAREARLVERIAMLSWQVDRAERAEEAQAAIRASRAEDVEEERRDEEVARYVAMIEDDPGRAVRRLLRSKEGCRWAVDSLKELIDALESGWWTDSLLPRLDALCAPAQPGRLRMSRAKALALALGGAEYGAIWPGGIPGLEPLGSAPTPEASAAWASRRDEIAREARPKWRADLKAILEDRLAGVELRLEELEARPDPAMQYAALASTFDPSEEPERLRRYVRSRERERHKLIAELDLHRLRRQENPIETEPAAAPPPQPAPEPPPPLTPFDSPPDSRRNDEGHGLNPPDLTANWVRSAPSECGSEAAAFDQPSKEAKPRK